MASSKNKVIMLAVTTLLLPLGKRLLEEIVQRWQKQQEPELADEANSSYYSAADEPE